MADAAIPDEAGPPSPARRRWRLPVLLVVLAVAAGLLVATQVLPRVLGGGMVGTEFRDPAEAPSLDGLVDADGKAADLADYEGDVVILYFGYLSCPDVCPTTLSTLAKAMDQLGDDADRVKVLMVSVDPERDQPADIETYVHRFDPRFEGLSAEEPELGRAASRWGIFYELEEPDASGYYAVTHTATLTGVDADGNLRVLWSYGITADALAHDIREMF